MDRALDRSLAQSSKSIPRSPTFVRRRAESGRGGASKKRKLRGALSGLIAPLVHAVIEGEREEERDRGGERGRYPPEPVPLRQRQPCRTAEEAIVDVARDLRTDEHPHAVRDEYEEALRLSTDRRSRLLVDVDLPGDEEEVVADAVQQDAQSDHPEHGI